MIKCTYGHCEGVAVLMAKPKQSFKFAETYYYCQKHGFPDGRPVASRNETNYDWLPVKLPNLRKLIFEDA